MTNTDLIFPLYRKLSNGKNFYKILSVQSFEEIQVIGSKSVKRTIRAKHFPEMMLIQDLIQFVEPYQLSSKEEYNQFEF